MYTQRTLIRVERASSVLKSCNPIGQFQCKVNGYTRIDQWDYRILKLRGHVQHESMSTGCTAFPYKRRIKVKRKSDANCVPIFNQIQNYIYIRMKRIVHCGTIAQRASIAYTIFPIKLREIKLSMRICVVN